MSVSKYKWTCPICGESRVQLEAGRRPRVSAENNLLSHVRSTRGNGHGPRGRCPDGLADGTVDANVSVRTFSDGRSAPLSEGT